MNDSKDPIIAVNMINVVLVTNINVNERKRHFLSLALVQSREPSFTLFNAMTCRTQ